MKKIRIVVVTASLSLLTLVSCVQKEQLPKNPKDKEEYKDSSGHSWIYDAMQMRWMFTPFGGGQSHYYYPAGGCWTNSSGIRVNPPASASPNLYRSSSVKPSTSGRINPSRTQGNKPASTGKSFGSSSKGSSLGA